MGDERPEELEPAEAAALFEDDPWFRLQDLGVPFDDLLPDLRAGLLLAAGRPIPGGWADIMVNGEHLIDWLCCGSPASRQASAFLLSANVGRA